MPGANGVLATPSPVRQQWLTTDLAIDEVLAFEDRYGPKHALLACHAAFPLIVDPELVNLIHINFLDGEQIPWIAEPDFLLSSFCRPIDDGLYQVDPHVREVLLVDLLNRVEDGPQRLVRLADFLLAYLEREIGSNQRREVMRARQWIAWSYLDPQKVVDDMTNLLTDGVDDANERAISLSHQLDVLTMMEIVRDPLEESLPQAAYQNLVETAQALAHYWYRGEKVADDVGRDATDLTGRPNPLLQTVVDGIRRVEREQQESPPSPPPDTARPPESRERPDKGSPFITPIQAAQLYNFPSGLDGRGQAIALIELGGGYRTDDIDAYFGSLGLPAPRVSSVSVDGARNDPDGSSGAEGQVMLGIEICGAIAPAAHIVVYFAPNTEQGFLDAITAAVNDDTHRPSVMCINWGAPERSWTRKAIQAMNRAFQSAAERGVTVCCASGDNGSRDGMSDSLADVDFPASSPFVLACGGTHVTVVNNAISSEVAWNDEPTRGGASGGGVSEAFPLPDWQTSASVPPSVNPGNRIGRGVPDVAINASPQSGYICRVDGQSLIFGGTSVSAALWAGLIARINQGLGRPVGFLNPLLYNPKVAGSGAFHDITLGNNGHYAAGPGWDACTGLGSPDGTALLQALASMAESSMTAR